MQEKDYNPIELMRHRDTDGDGVSDYIDSNGYSKPSDKYRYNDISHDEYLKLKANGFDVGSNSCPSSTVPGRHIIRYTENQAQAIETIIKPAVCSAVLK